MKQTGNAPPTAAIELTRMRRGRHAPDPRISISRRGSITFNAAATDLYKLATGKRISVSVAAGAELRFCFDPPVGEFRIQRKHARGYTSVYCNMLLQVLPQSLVPGTYPLARGSNPDAGIDAVAYVTEAARLRRIRREHAHE